MSGGRSMTDFAPLTPPDTAAPSTQQGPGRASAGTLLREMREAAGVDVGLLASALKVSVQKVEALEADRLDLLPDVTFARGLASTVCRACSMYVRSVVPSQSYQPPPHFVPPMPPSHRMMKYGHIATDPLEVFLSLRSELFH
mgnify:CR=1 FL=1